MGVGGVVLIDGRVVLVRRGKEPLRGRWVIPGGTVELGETLHEALVREMKEETGLLVRPRDVVLVFDRIQREGASVEYHYVIIDYACDYLSGELKAGSDADEVALVGPEELDRYDLPPQARDLVVDVFRRGV
ncbi:MAG TPA: NUDIX hydrolase [Candidatus Eisenbacteria bacterium]|nr:NUDIX hydrolase [Candidatus Eisenbacteria bacterium]